MSLDTTATDHNGDTPTAGDQLVIELERVRSAIRTANTMLNDAADENDLCSRYERVLERINAATDHVLGLTGRRRAYAVDVTVHARVVARDQAHADELADKLRLALYYLDTTDAFERHFGTFRSDVGTLGWSVANTVLERIEIDD